MADAPLPTLTSGSGPVPLSASKRAARDRAVQNWLESEENLRATAAFLFKKADLNKNGVIERSEAFFLLKELFLNSGFEAPEPLEVQDMWVQMDLNKDNVVNAEEWLEFLSSFVGKEFLEATDWAELASFGRGTKDCTLTEGCSLRHGLGVLEREVDDPSAPAAASDDEQEGGASLATTSRKTAHQAASKEQDMSQCMSPAQAMRARKAAAADSRAAALVTHLEAERKEKGAVKAPTDQFRHTIKRLS